MGYFQVTYEARVVIYERKMFIRLATGVDVINKFKNSIAKLKYAY